MKTITISSRNGVVSEKTASGCPGEEFLGAMEGVLAAGGTVWKKPVLGCTQMGVSFQSTGDQKGNPG
jgi:hypothetical protein